MKKILIMALAITFTLGASAQRITHGYRGRSYYAPVTRIYVSPFSYGIGFGYPYFGFPYYGFPPYAYGYPYRYRSIPYKLELQIEDIKNDYKNQIRAARKDKTISHSQRRQEIRTLKADRDKAIIDAKMNYARPGRNNQYQPDRNQGMNNQNQYNNNQGNNNSPSEDNSNAVGTKS